MLELARRNPGEEVRAAMRQMLQVPGSSYSSELTMALLAMHDEPTLDLVLAGMQKEQHPYAQVDAGSKPEALTPLQYLLYDNPNPPHGFSVEDVRKVIAGSDSSMVVSPFDCAIERLSDAMLRMLAESQFGSWRRADRGSTSWQLVAMQRYREHQGQGRWKEWLHAALTTDKLPAVILEHLNAEEIEQNLATIEALRNNPKTAIAALDALQRAGKPIDIPALLADDNREPRLWAFHQVASGKAQADDSAMVPFLRDDSWPLRKKATEYLGAKVCTAAVPGLINLLRDPEEQVRTTAADALTKIRFYHEQQAHWDRVLKGLDASPASAMEKLLLQCKPDAPKAQRLLAITSLGTLGAPEALPFLIDWSNEADAEVAAAAKAAITQIHLQPRR